MSSVAVFHFGGGGSFIVCSSGLTTRVSDGHRLRAQTVSNDVHKSQRVLTDTRVAVRSNRLLGPVSTSIKLSVLKLSQGSDGDQRVRPAPATCRQIYASLSTRQRKRRLLMRRETLREL